jgi:hypothetical protein
VLEYRIEHLLLTCQNFKFVESLSEEEEMNGKVYKVSKYIDTTGLMSCKTLLTGLNFLVRN